MWLAVDTETELIRPGLQCPRLVCLSWHDGSTGGLVGHREASRFLRKALVDDAVRLVLHNAAFDVLVLVQHDPTLLGLVVELLEAGRIVDTLLVEQLQLIAKGELGTNPRPNLASLARKHLDVELAKGEDTWRLRYGELRDVEVDQWPEDARSYALKDAETTYKVYEQQRAQRYQPPDLALQVRASVALGAVSAWGLRTDPEAVEALEVSLLTELLDHRAQLLEVGLLKKTRQGVARDMASIRAHVEEHLGNRAGRTDSGQVKTDDATLEAVGTDQAESLRRYKSIEKIVSGYLPHLWAGTTRPITPRYNTLVATGRTSSFSPNIQQQPRAGGVRECFVPRRGCLFAAADWSSIEMAALAQVCLDLFGQSRLADALNDGLDPHLAVAAQLLCVDYQTAKKNRAAGDARTKRARQLAKIANFGFAGGMGPGSFVYYAKGFGVELTEEGGHDLREAWRAAWPEMGLYFEHIAEVTGDQGAKAIVQLRSKRKRGGVGFCDGANTYFQGLVADLAKATLWRLFRACYGGELRARPVAFIHDEVLAEVIDNEQAPDVAERLSRIMVETAGDWIPDVRVEAEPVLMARWYKDAETVRDDAGRLMEWRPC